MTQKTIKALYKQPVNYKLIKEGYKTIDGVINAQDGMPQVLDLPTPSELYTTDLQYNVDTEVNGAPIITTESFTLPDDEICEAKEYCYAPKGIDYNYITKQNVRHYDNFTIAGSPTITSAGIISGFSDSNYLTIDGNPNFQNANSWEFVTKVSVGSTSEHQKILFGYGINFGVTASGYLHLWLYNNGTLFVDSNVCSASLLSANPFIKLSFDGIIYSCYISLDGETWTLEYSYNSTTKIIDNGPLRLGKDGYGGSEYWRGTIDLSESYIKINDEIWWVPYTYHEEEVTIQIPGILDSSVTTDNWQQSQEYKLYQLKNQSNLNVLQLTENNITNSSEKYKQYIQQLTIPARNYKWYYNGIPEGKYNEYYCYGTTSVSNGVITGFGENGYVRMSVYPGYYDPEYSFTVIVPFETGNTASNNALLQLITRGYDYELEQYSEKCIYFSCIHNGKFSITNDQNLQTFEEGIQLSPNTKYWTAVYISSTKIETYIISDNSYDYDNLPVLTNWTKEYTINFSNMIDVYDNEFFFGHYEDVLQNGVSYGSFNGKLYIDECFGTSGLSIDYNDLIWEPYRYYNYVYNWYANKSIYDYTENQNHADTLDFSNSWLNVTSNWKTQKKYVNPKVCLMPIDGGETIITYPLNAIEIGNTNFNTYTGIANRFSSDDYLQLQNPFNPGENPWEMVIKIRTGTNLQTWQEIFHSSVAPNDSGRYGASVIIHSGNFELDISTDGSSWIGTDLGTFVLSEDTDYWVKVGWNSNEYYLEYSTNGVDYTRDITYTSSNHLPNLTNSWIGIYRNSSYMYPMLGTIGLSESYIKINDEIWWQGVNLTTKEHQYITTKDTLNITNYETATVNDGVISDITGLMITNNSITIYKDKPFEIFGRIKTGNSASGIQEIFTDYGSNLFLLRNSNTYWNVCYYVNGVWRQTTNGGFYSDTSYLIRLRYFPTATTKDGFDYSAKTVYFEYLKENDSGWTRDYSYSLADYFFGNDTSVTSQTFNMTVGSQNGAELWTGSIDLKECYVKVDSKIVWKGINFKEAINGCIVDNSTDDGQEHQFDVYYDSNYTQPMLVSSGQSYSSGIKVDTITIPSHKTWSYTAGGIWTQTNL